MKTHPLIAHFGSLRSTLALFALLAAVVLLRPALWPLAAVIAALTLNLAFALMLHPLLRQRLPLLCAHLALLALVGLVALGRLLALDGRFELTEGVAFDGTLIDGEAGPLHASRLQQLSFTHEGFEIDYAPGRKRGATRNTVRWTDDAGQLQRSVIGDHHPLLLQGHRIYTSPNKGFAPLLRWQPDRGEALLGAVHLPSFPAQELHQSRTWQLPDGREVWVLLQLPEALINPQTAGRFEMPRSHKLVVRLGEQRAELTPGQTMAVPGGQLVYEGLRTWMGYRVAYDPTLPWLLATALLAALSLALHYGLKFRAPPRSVAAPAGAWGGVRHG